MQFFPGYGHGFASPQVLHAARHFLVPCRLHGLIHTFETVEQSVGQRGALVDRESKRPF